MSPCAPSRRMTGWSSRARSVPIPWRPIWPVLAVEGFLRLGGEAELGRLAVVTIGVVTSGTVRAAGFPVAGEATSPTVDALVDAVARAVPATVRPGSAAEPRGAQA